MDLRLLEYAAEIVFRMCREHPEICPHHYEWIMTRTLENGEQESHYVCKLCGNELITHE